MSGPMSAGPDPGDDGWGVGIDIGGTRTKAVLRRGATVVARRHDPTPPDIAHRMGPVLAEVLGALVADAGERGPGAPPSSLGVVVPGLVDEERAVAVWSANLGWTDLDVRAALAPHVHADVVLGHDVRAGLLAEHLVGAARGVDDVLFVPVGTGIAAAQMTGGHLVRGSRWTGELGHVVVAPDGPACGCGRRGCLEAVAGGVAIARRWQEAGGSGDAEALVAAMGAGDEAAAAIWADTVRALAGAIAPVVATAGTRLVLVGGGLAQAGEVLLAPLRAQLASVLPRGQDIEVAGAALGEWAGAVGASYLADDRVARSTPPA